MTKKWVPEAAVAHRESLMILVRVNEAIHHYGLEGRAYEYDMKNDCVVVWATDTITPYVYVRIYP
jgi:hypothetical protein